MTSVGLQQPLDALGSGGIDLQRLLAGLKQQQQQQQQQQQGLPGEVAVPEQAAKRRRNSEAAGLSADTGESPVLPQPLTSMAAAPLGLPMQFLQFSGSGMQAVGALGSSLAFVPGAQTSGMPMASPQLAHVPGMPGMPGMLPTPGLQCLNGAAAGGGMLATAQPPPHALQQQPGGAGSGSHSHTGTDSADDGSGEGQRRGSAARRTSEERMNANKEKNRRAQQRFRLRQKEKMQWLESELQRLRALCTQHGIDPSPTAAPPAALRCPPCSGAALSLPQQAQAATPAAVPGAQVAMQAAAAQATPFAAQQGTSTQRLPLAHPSTEQMYEQLEAMLERCPGVPADAAIAFLTAFQRADAETKRCQFSSLRRRFDAARMHEVASCVAHFVAAGQGAGAAGGAVLDSIAVAGVRVPAQEELAAASKAPSPRPDSGCA